MFLKRSTVNKRRLRLVPPDAIPTSAWVSLFPQKRVLENAPAVGHVLQEGVEEADIAEAVYDTPP